MNWREKGRIHLHGTARLCLHSNAMPCLRGKLCVPLALPRNKRDLGCAGPGCSLHGLACKCAAANNDHILLVATAVLEHAPSVACMQGALRTMGEDMQVDSFQCLRTSNGPYTPCLLFRARREYMLHRTFLRRSLLETSESRPSALPASV